jgi:DNA helicase-2/ATP-dependent DNA helicase PcrA
VQPKSIQELRTYLEEQQKKTTPLPAASKSRLELKPGSRVYHDKFGDGIVLRRERSGNDIKLVVTFSRVGRKSLIERYAKLKVL